jgi:23S rRNA pseudouridine1911/1915/1917 synthase
MAVVASGKPATTQYRITRRLRAHTYIQITLQTGRTHQIRVHMAYLGHPVFGDPVYGGRPRIPASADPRVADALHRFKRQALHATRLTLSHPRHGKTLSFEAPLPSDMAHLLRVLDVDAADTWR